MNSGGWAHFDTYFNSFMKNKWSKYTNLDNLQINLDVQGTLRISILNKERERNGIVTNRCIDEIEVVCPERRMVSIPVKQFDRNGMYTFSIYAISNGCHFYGGNYSTNIPDDKQKNINIGISICTYRREKYILKNIDSIQKRLLKDDSTLKGHIHVFITDNAKSLGGMIEKSEYIHIFPNKNVGGAGGFTRCLIEILNRPHLGITHALLMDDDVTIEPEAIFRTYTFLTLVKDEYKNIFIGGSMLRLDSQTIQTECGAVWNKGMLKSLKHNLDLRTCESCLYNDIEESCDYNAWWYCVTPMEYIKTDNLPMPIFIRGDDVEYGLRNVEQITQVNGICVWHEPFENKYSSMMYYYILRNRCIDNAVRGIDYPVEMAIKDYTEQWENEMKLCRYKNAHLLSSGINDFLEGIEWLKRTDAEKLNSKVMNEGYKLVPVTQLDFNWSYSDFLESINYKPPVDSLYTRALIKFNMMKRDKEVVVPTFDPIPRRCADAKKILNYDYSTGKGFITTYDEVTFNSEKKYFKKTVNRMKKDYSKTVKEYNEKRKELTNIEFWKSYLNL